jgi:anti-sigma B factor antagonist
VSALDIETRVRDSVAYVRFSGELDITAADEAERRVREVEESAPRDLILDLRELEFMDSTGLRLVLSVDTRARERGGRAVIVRGPHSVHRVFELALLEERLEFVDDPAEAGG